MRSIIKMMTVVFLLSITASMFSMQKGLNRKDKKKTTRQKTTLPKAKKPFMLVRDNHSGSLIETDIDAALPFDKHGSTLLHILAQSGQTDAVLSYVKKGVEIDVLNNDQNTPLLLTVLYNHIKTAEILLDNDANPNKKNIAGLNCLDLAIGMKYEALISLLKKHGAKESTTPDEEYKKMVFSKKTLEYVEKLSPKKQSEWFDLFEKVEAETDPKNTNAFLNLFTFCKRNGIPTSE